MECFDEVKAAAWYGLIDMHAFCRFLAQLHTRSSITALLPFTLADKGLDRFLAAQQKVSSTDDDVQDRNSTECLSVDCYRYYNSRTKPYFIESFPDVDFDTGEFYGGSIPIDESDPTRTLFFIFKPATEEPVDEVAIWLNGGPGCSSFTGR